MLRSQIKFTSTLFKGWWVSRGQSPWSQVNLTFSRRAKLLKLTAKSSAATEKYLTAKKAQFTSKKGKTEREKSVCKPIKCELRQFCFPHQNYPRREMRRAKR